MRFVSMLALTLAAVAVVPWPLVDSSAAAQSSRAVSVTIHGLRNDRGLVEGALYTTRADWLDPTRPYARCETRIVMDHARCVFQRTPDTHFAIAFLHDEDEDREMDRDALGIPREGFAFSNDVHPSLSAPSFESATVPTLRPTLVVHAQYVP